MGKIAPQPILMALMALMPRDLGVHFIAQEAAFIVSANL